MWKSLASNTLTACALLLFLLAGLILWAQSLYKAPGPLEAALCVEVPSGSSFRDLSKNLYETGAISNDRLFRVGADYTEKTSLLKAGNFLIPEQASMAEISEIVTRGGAARCGTEILYRLGISRMSIQIRGFDPATRSYAQSTARPSDELLQDLRYLELLDREDTRFRLSMAEGVTSARVVAALNDIGVLAGEIGERPAEGSLAPQSYDLKPDASRASIIEQMQRKQAEILQSAWSARSQNLPIKSADEALILASIVEKETGIASERGVVASVFINRLSRGMRLQTDPTVIYGITKGERSLGRGLRRSELDAATPWNTYKIPGLPPTPIANPGAASLRAVLEPEKTDFIYFVADGTGGHAFAKTLDEHNANVRAWRAIEANR